MSTTVRKMDAQLKTWLAKIDKLTARSLRPGVAVNYDTANYLADLRTLHAAALTEFSRFRVADATERARLKPQTVLAWNELAAALRNVEPTS